ncbi:hypothetical protein AB1Y20_019447 [Prymnesium parvum]|uniref:Uncharacterized protein n=1 Tax=Prymnesium parvum TaxID=97485 RepID=A0AB34IVH0_PRYPA
MSAVRPALGAARPRRLVPPRAARRPARAGAGLSAAAAPAAGGRQEVWPKAGLTEGRTKPILETYSS